MSLGSTSPIGPKSPNDPLMEELKKKLNSKKASGPKAGGAPETEAKVAQVGQAQQGASSLPPSRPLPPLPKGTLLKANPDSIAGKITHAVTPVSDPTDEHSIESHEEPLTDSPLHSPPGSPRPNPKEETQFVKASKPSGPRPGIESEVKKPPSPKEGANPLPNLPFIKPKASAPTTASGTVPLPPPSREVPEKPLTSSEREAKEAIMLQNKKLTETLINDLERNLHGAEVLLEKAKTHLAPGATIKHDISHSNEARQKVLIDDLDVVLTTFEGHPKEDLEQKKPYLFTLFKKEMGKLETAFKELKDKNSDYKNINFDNLPRVKTLKEEAEKLQKTFNELKTEQAERKNPTKKPPPAMGTHRNS